ncbi:MAG: hypothetical protein F2536_05455 [Actinobacteria bacterium]|uniref:Unannotated protein n=1 Tax=freshwater metagenome TaxID=449393 RepID=A0A6J6CLY4_9ZZZZ|nr:hypothetical protein [Actinomycetota bacterium]
MRKASFFIAAVLVLSVGFSASADEEDTRVFQWSKPDRSTPAGMNVDFDLTELSMGHTVDDELQIYATVKGIAAATKITQTSYVELLIDTNLDKREDYSIRILPFTETGYKIVGTLMNLATNTPVTSPAIVTYSGETCDVYIWSTTQSTDYGFEFTKNCINMRPEINLAVVSTADGVAFDRLPDGTAWQRFKTDYMKAATCNSGKRNQKLTYDGTTYICLKSGSKWGWKDYGPIAAKNSKFLTEKAYYLCKLNNKYGASLGDNGKTLTLDGAFKYFITESDYNCVTRVLQMSSSVKRRVEITRALDGLQEAKWGRITSFWNYHPDSGLNITFSYN